MTLKPILNTVALIALTGLGGCVYDPYGYYAAAPVPVYQAPVEQAYYPPPPPPPPVAYYPAPAPAYYPAYPAVGSLSLGFGFGGGGRGGYHRGGRYR